MEYFLRELSINVTGKVSTKCCFGINNQNCNIVAKTGRKLDEKFKQLT